MAGSATKHCDACGEDKPKTAEFFVPYGGRTNQSQFRSTCRECREANKRPARQGGSPQQRVALDIQMRRLEALERTEVYQECLAGASSRPKAGPERSAVGSVGESALGPPTGS